MVTLFRDPFFNVVDKVFESTRDSLSPKTKVIRNESEYKILISVPGLTKDDLKITTKDGELKISFDNSDENQVFVSTFSKTYTIPDDVKEKDIIGKVDNGILKLILPISSKKTTERLIYLD